MRIHERTRIIATGAAVLACLATSLSGCDGGGFSVGITSQEGCGCWCYGTCNLETTDKVDYLDILTNITKGKLLGTPSGGIYPLDTTRTGGMQNDPDGEAVLKHVVGCAFDSSIVVSGIDAENHAGVHDLAPDWATQGIDGDTATVDAVGRCIMAYINDNGVHVELMTGADTLYGPNYNPEGPDGGVQSQTDYMVMSGVFYGHGLGHQGGEEHFWSCYTLPKALRDALGDNEGAGWNDVGAAASRDCPYPNTKCGVHNTGFCGEVCGSHSGFHQGWQDCKAEPNAVGDDNTEYPTYVYLRHDTTPTSGQGYPKDGKVDSYVCGSGGSCNYTSGSNNKLIVHTTSARTTGATLTCDDGDYCAFHIDGTGTNGITGDPGSKVAVVATRPASVTCNGNTCDITFNENSDPGTISCTNNASCRLTCLDGHGGNCNFDSCWTSATTCDGYGNSVFCGRACPGTCSGAGACGTVPSGQGCSCTDDCEETNDCCEDKYLVCGASLPVEEPIGHWKFDLSGSNNVPPGSYTANVSAAFYSSGKPVIPNIPNSYSLGFDGVNDYATIPDGNEIDFAPNHDFTVTLWVKAQPSQPVSNWVNYIVSKGESTFPYTIWIYNQSAPSQVQGKIVGVRLDNSGHVPGVISTTDVLDNKWHHVAFVKQGSTLSLYVDGVLESTATDTSTGTTTNSKSVCLGALCKNDGSRADYYYGSVDDLRIYNRGLNARAVRFMSKVSTRWRLRNHSVPSSNKWGLREAAFCRSVSGGTCNERLTGTVIKSSEDPGGPATQAFDQDPVHGWITAGTEAGTAHGSYIGIDHGSHVERHGLYFRTSAYANRNPDYIDVEYYNPNLDKWIVTDKVATTGTNTDHHYHIDTLDPDQAH